MSGVVRQVFLPFEVPGAETPPGESEVLQHLPTFYTLAEKESAGGWYPIGSNAFWHGGLHLCEPTDRQRNKEGEGGAALSIGLQAGAMVRACAAGTIVAARLEATPKKDGWVGSRNFILIRHTREHPETGASQEFFSLYMHLAYSDEVALEPPPAEKPADDDKQRVAWADEVEGIGSEAVLALDVDVRAGALLWPVGVTGRKKTRRVGLHWELFSRENLFAGEADWLEVEDRDEDCFMEDKDLEQVFAGIDGLNVSDGVDRQELIEFYNSAAEDDLSKLRQVVALFRSEWAMNWSEENAALLGGLEDKGFKVSAKKLAKRYDPYMWWDEAVDAAEAPWPGKEHTDKLVWHYNPLRLLEVLDAEFWELAKQPPAMTLSKVEEEAPEEEAPEEALTIQANDTVRLSLTGLYSLRGKTLELELRDTEQGDGPVATFSLTVDAGGGAITAFERTDDGAEEDGSLVLTLDAQAIVDDEKKKKGVPAEHASREWHAVEVDAQVERDASKALVTRACLRLEVEGVAGDPALVIVRSGWRASMRYALELVVVGGVEDGTLDPVAFELDAANVGYNEMVLAYAFAYAGGTYDPCYDPGYCKTCWDTKDRCPGCFEEETCSECGEARGACKEGCGQGCEAGAVCQLDPQGRLAGACKDDADCGCGSTAACKDNKYYRGPNACGNSCDCAADAVCHVEKSSGLPETVVIEEDGEEHSIEQKTNTHYCCGFTLWNALAVSQREGLFSDALEPYQLDPAPVIDGLSIDKLAKLKARPLHPLQDACNRWFGYSDWELNFYEDWVRRQQVANGIQTLGIGRPLRGHFDPESETTKATAQQMAEGADGVEQPLPGDYLQIWRSTNLSSGHSVIFLRWERDAEGNVTGVHYRSTQPSTGIANKTETFAGNGVKSDRLFFARLTGPQA